MWHSRAIIYFFIGIVLGFLACSLAGYIVSGHERFKHFKRFYPAIQPEMQYYPTAHELLQTANHLARNDKVLVLIGGNSIFKGMGQKDSALWTSALQTRLGERYQVLNYAIDAAAFNAFAGVAYRMLRERYQHIIFVTTCVPEIPGGTDQHQYEYVFWDAYYKKLFHPDPYEKKAIQKQRKEDWRTREGQDIHIMSELDSLFYFRNLWNAVSYHVGFKAKKNDTDHHDFFRKNQVNIQDVLKKKEEVERTLTDTRWLMQSETIYRDAWQQPYRYHTLCMIPTFNPALMTQLSPATQYSYADLLKKFSDTLNKLGYHAVIFTDTLTAQNYVDARHLSASGGDKLAIQVEHIVKEWH